MKNKYEIRGEEVVIFLKSKGAVLQTLIDRSELEKANNYPFTWFAQYNKSTDSYYVTGKVTVGGKRKSVKLHRLIMDVPDDFKVDHFNHDTLDNRKINLRIATSCQNAQNQKLTINNKSGKIGISYNDISGKWRARITINKKISCLGEYDSKETADEVVKKARSTFWTHSPDFGVYGNDFVLPERKKCLEIQSGIKGITWIEEKKKWMVRTYVEKKRVYLGLYDDLNEAIERLKELKNDNKIPEGRKLLENQSTIRGISWSSESGKWIVRKTMRSGKRKYLGRYSELNEAIKVFEEYVI